MLDIQFIRENAEKVKQNNQRKNVKVDIDELLNVDNERRSLLSEMEHLRQKRNQLSETAKDKKPDQKQIAEGQKLKLQVSDIEDKFEKAEAKYTELIKAVPNMAADDVPVGTDETKNVVVKTHGKPPEFDFAPKNHWDIAKDRGWIDKERAAKIAGTRFAYIKGNLAKLHFAIINWAIDVLSDEYQLSEIAKSAKLKISAKPFMLVLPPLLIRTDVYDAMDRLEPRDDRYKIEGEDLWLQGSAEHVLGSMHINEIIDETEFPIRYMGYATSFRKEAGSYGKDLEGIFRLHQFDKLEMQSLNTKEEALSEHLFMIAIQEHLMQALELPYQVIMKCTADIGKPNARGVDINAWMAGQAKYRETHTADYMTDYQARRLKTRVRRGSGEVELVHTNDATVFSQRPLIAIIENNQTSDGRVRIPTVLKSYMNGEDYL